MLGSVPAFAEIDEAAAIALDECDPLPSLRDEFAVPPATGGSYPEIAYFAGNSLGLMHQSVPLAIERELGEWRTLAVEAWFEAGEPWLELAGSLRRSIGTLVGARDDEVVVMSSLTVNLHLLLTSFYRPSGERTRMLIEESCFPSDSHAAITQVRARGLDPARELVHVAPGSDRTMGTAEIVDAIERHGDRLALVLLAGVNYLTGEALDLDAITAAGHRVGATVGWDLAHGIGNVPLSLHGSGADFAVWCHYKYVNGGPGAPGGAFVHERHGRDPERLRLGGWWAVDPAVRFKMEPAFEPRPGAEGWAVSTPSIIALAPLRAALEPFDRVGIVALRERSLRLTGALERMVADVACGRRAQLITPTATARRGAQLSLAVVDAGAKAEAMRTRHGVICDVREPDVLRFAPAPLYNTNHDCWRAAAALHDVLEETS